MQLRICDSVWLTDCTTLMSCLLLHTRAYSLLHPLHRVDAFCIYMPQIGGWINPKTSIWISVQHSRLLALVLH